MFVEWLLICAGLLLLGIVFFLARLQFERRLKERDKIIDVRSSQLALSQEAISFFGNFNGISSSIETEDQLLPTVLVLLEDSFTQFKMNLFSISESSARQIYRAENQEYAHRDLPKDHLASLSKFTSNLEQTNPGPRWLGTSPKELRFVSNIPLIAKNSLVGALHIRSAIELGDYQKALFFDISRLLAQAIQVARFRQSTKRLKSTFARLVDSKVAEKLISDRETSEGFLGGIRTKATVMFVDIRGFTTFSEMHDSEYVVAALNNFFLHMEKRVRDELGFINKFLGDGFMALFGATTETPDHEAQSIRAALAMAKTISEGWNDEHAFKIGIGIASGEMLVGTVGSPSRLEFTAVGDIVNVASRLEGQNKVFGTTVIASKETIDGALPNLNSTLATRKLDSLQLKGKNSLVEAYEIIV